MYFLISVLSLPVPLYVALITCVHFVVSDSDNEKNKQKTNVLLQPLSWKGLRVLVDCSYT